MTRIEDTSRQRERLNQERCRNAFASRHSPRTFAIVRAKSRPRTAADSLVAFGAIIPGRFTNRNRSRNRRPIALERLREWLVKKAAGRRTHSVRIFFFFFFSSANDRRGCDRLTRPITVRSATFFYSRSMPTR